MVATLQAAVNNPQTDRLKQILQMSPRLLGSYFSIALRDIDDCKLANCAFYMLFITVDKCHLTS